MATVAESVKESLVGVVKPPDLSNETRVNWLQYAKKDDEDGQSYMDREAFVNAIAPPGEDYVSSSSWQLRRC